MATTYSFVDTTVSIFGPGGGYIISQGVADEGITIAMRGDKGEVIAAADGTPIHNLFADKTATITIRLLRNSPANAVLSGLYKYQTQNSANHGKNTIIISNTPLGDVHTASFVGFKKQPTALYGKGNAIYEWEFNVGSIEMTFLGGSLTGNV